MSTDTVTVYNALGEADRHAAYRRTVLRGVRAEETSGAVATMQGRSSADGLLLFVPGALPGYVEPEHFTGSAVASPFAVPGAGGSWTLRDGDLVVWGLCELEMPPTSIQQLEQGRRVYRITGVETLRDRRGLVHHLEVSAS
jgi:hypothetical protein